ncbi:MAG: AGE family epimerase/isomerase [Candidatus Omnitrophica bacterium]|nr:AGE family epimerase/isomerase [Candidatus Omnitrophota bacterium]
MKIIIIVLTYSFLLVGPGGAFANSLSDECLKLVNRETTSTPDADNVLESKPDIEGIASAIINTRNPDTKLSPSHWGHPGYENLAFLYDKTVDALILKAAGRQKEAEEILDYIVGRFEIPVKEVAEGSDTNSIYGILKIIRSGDRVLKSPINSIDISSKKKQGSGVLEFWTTPGPLSFLIFALLQVDENKYKDAAVELGEVLSSMQDGAGGIRDGDRAPGKVHTEPHMDGYGAFLMLYDATGDGIWKERADKAYDWFEKNVYHPEEGAISQGLWEDGLNDIFAEDVYAWTMAGPAGDRIPIPVLKNLTENMLSKSLAKITLTLPDASVKTVILVDFTDSKDPRVISARGGFHPMGSIEWTGGAILALQKNAVRLWRAGDKKEAVRYKAIAESLLIQSFKCFYEVEAVKGTITFYASGQGYEVAPFGSIRSGFSEGWVTPSFLARTADGQNIIKGGSSVGAWPVLPYLGLNPFVLADEYKKYYDDIPVEKKDMTDAFDFINIASDKHRFNEVMCRRAPESPSQIVEPAVFIREMWRAIINAERGIPCEGGKNCYEEAMRWAGKVVSDPVWIELAKRDNGIKASEFKGIINYKWGEAYKENTHPVHQAIARYPMLNEVGCAMWGLARANFELGRTDEAKYWMGRIIDEVPLHQIAAVQEDFEFKGDRTIIGYWNSIVSWETNPDNNARTGAIAVLYKEVLASKGIQSALPNTVELMSGSEEPLAKEVGGGGSENQ